MDMKVNSYICSNCGQPLENIFRRGGITKCSYCDSLVQIDFLREDPSHRVVSDKSLFERAWIYLKDYKFKEAKETFDRVLDRNPRCADAYWGLMLVEHGCIDDNDLHSEKIKSCIKNRYKDNKAYINKADKEKIKDTVKIYLGVNLKHAYEFADDFAKEQYDAEINCLSEECYNEYYAEYCENKYGLGVDAMNREDWSSAVYFFGLILEYLDSREKYNLCFENHKKKSFMNLRAELKNRYCSDERLLEMSGEFESFGSYYNSQALAKRCKGIVKRRKFEFITVILSNIISVICLVWYVSFVINIFNTQTVPEVFAILPVPSLTEGWGGVITLCCIYFLGALLIGFISPFTGRSQNKGVNLWPVLYNIAILGVLYVCGDIWSSSDYMGFIGRIFFMLFATALLELFMVPVSLLATFFGRLFTKPLKIKMYGK